MNARTIRRAIERKAQKQARKEAARTMAAAAATTSETCTVSELQLDANRRNALLSTGPVTVQGKAVSSRNALKTGLTGRTVLLPNEDAALYEHHVQTFFADFQPVGDRERELVQSIADTKWRLARIPGLEFGIYALGRQQFAEEFANHPQAEAAALIQAKTFLAYQRQLNNLSIQESRLRRQCEKDTAELARLQQLRAAAEKRSPPQHQPNPPQRDQPLRRKLGSNFRATNSMPSKITSASIPISSRFLKQPENLKFAIVGNNVPSTTLLPGTPAYRSRPDCSRRPSRLPRKGLC